MTTDRDMVYLLDLEVVGDDPQSAPQVITDLREIPVYPEVAADRMYTFATATDLPERRALEVVGELEGSGGGGVLQAYNAPATRNLRVPVRSVFTPLTRENFDRLRDHMVGWETYDRQLATTGDIRHFFRVMLDDAIQEDGL